MQYVIQSLIFLLLSSFCPENSTWVQVFNTIGLICTVSFITPLIMDLEHITISPTRIPFPVLGHIFSIELALSTFLRWLKVINRASGLFDNINTLLILAPISFYKIIFCMGKNGIFT